MARKTIFQYGLVDGKPAIIGEGGASIFDADQNNFIRQEGFQDAILADIKEKVGIPSGFSGLFKSADPAKILPAIAELEDPRHMMLALRDVSSYLPAGMGDMVDKIGGGTPEFRTNLQAALRNPQFQKFILTQEGGAQFGQGVAILQSAEATQQLKDLGLDDAAIQRVTQTVSTRVLADIGAGKLDGNFDKIQDLAIQEFQKAAFGEKLDGIVRDHPQFSKIADIMKGDPALMQSFLNAYMKDSTVAPGIEAMLKGEGGMPIGKLEELLADPTTRETFRKVLDAVAEKGDIQFSHVTDLATKLENKDYAGVANSLKAMGVEAPAGLEHAESFGMLQTMIQKFGQTSFGAAILGFLKEALGPNGFLGQLLNTLGMGGLATSLRGMFEAPVTTAAATGPDGKVTNLSAEEFKEKFKAAMEGRDLGRRYDNPEHVRAALIETGVDPKLADEMTAIRSDVTLNRDFSQAVTNAGSLDAVADAVTRFHQDLKGGGTLRHAVGAMAPAVG